MTTLTAFRCQPNAAWRCAAWLAAILALAAIGWTRPAAATPPPTVPPGYSITQFVTGLPGTPTQLADDPATGTLYFGSMSNMLYSVASDGLVNTVSTDFTDGDGNPYGWTDLKFNGGAIYMATGGNLDQYDIASDTATHLSTALTGFSGECGIAAVGNLLYITSGNFGPGQMDTYDLTTNTLTTVNSSLPESSSSLEYDPGANKLYFASLNDGSYYQFDPSDNTYSLIATEASSSDCNFVVDPSGQYLYVRTSDGVDQITIADGTITQFATNVPGGPFGSDVTFGPSSSGSGWSLYIASNDSSIYEVTPQVPTTTALAVGPNPSVYGQPVTFTATVASSDGGGTVQFNIDGTDVGSPVALTDGAAIYADSSLAVGSHTIIATYSGDAASESSASGSATQTVNQADTILSLMSSPNPSVYGQSVTFTATAAVAAPGSGMPTGTVSFFDGATLLGTATLDGSGAASFSTSALTVGDHSITAVYSGDANCAGSTSSVASQTVNQADTVTTLLVSPSPASDISPLTVTATVAPVAPGVGIPTGIVQFAVNGQNVGAPVALINGVATASYPGSIIPPGSYTFTATYSGDANFLADSPGQTTEVITPSAATHFLVTAPATATAGSAISLTVTAQDSQGQTATGYTGTVHLTSSDGKVVLPADAALVNGIGQFTVTLKTAGPQTVTATDTAITGTSSSIAVSASSAGQIAFAQQPTTTVAGASITPAPSVTVTDTFGNPVAGVGVTVSLAAGTGTIAGTANQTTDANGHAAFPGLAINLPGQKTLQAASGSSLKAASNPFTVTADDHLAAQGIAISAVERVSFSGHVATATDTDKTSPASDFTATIAWGDGKSSAGSVSGSNGSFSVSGTHTYAAAGSYMVKTTLTDTQPGGPTAQATSTATVKDVTAPTTTIALNPTEPAAGGAYATPVTITLAATDPDYAASAITTYYTVDGGAQQTYSKPFTVGGNGEHTVRYFSKDAAGNTEAAKSASFTIKLPPAVLHTFAAGLQLFSVPKDYSGIVLGTALSQVNPTLVVWLPNELQYVMSPSAPADALRPGQGYWARFGQATDLFDLGTPTPTAKPFAIALKKGWNMVGDPFPSAVSFSAISVKDGAGHSYGFTAANQAALVSLTTYSYPAGSKQYQAQGADGSLAPYEGYWIYAFTDCTLEVPAP